MTILITELCNSEQAVIRGGCVPAVAPSLKESGFIRAGMYRPASVIRVAAKHLEAGRLKAAWAIASRRGHHAPIASENGLDADAGNSCGSCWAFS